MNVSKFSTKVERDKSLEFGNLLSFRKKMNQSEVNDELLKLNDFMRDHQLNQQGPMIQAVFGFELVNGEQVFDFEYLIPVDRVVNTTIEHSDYEFKEKFRLMHAIHKRHVGDYADIQESYSEIEQYINENNLQQITALYTVHVNADKASQEPSIVDIYIGINPSIL